MILYLWFTHQEDRVWSLLGYLGGGWVLFMGLMWGSDDLMRDVNALVDSSLKGEAFSLQIVARGVEPKRPVQEVLESLFVGGFLGYILGGGIGGLSGVWRGKIVDRMMRGSHIGLCVLGSLFPLLQLGKWAYMSMV